MGHLGSYTDFTYLYHMAKKPLLQVRSSPDLYYTEHAPVASLKNNELIALVAQSGVKRTK